MMKGSAISGSNHNTSTVGTVWSIIGNLQILYFPVLLIEQKDNTVYDEILLAFSLD